MTDTGSYPSVPHRLNFVDIRTWQVHDEVANDDLVNAGSAVNWTQLYPAGATLENGIHIKLRNPPLAGYKTLRVGYYNDHTHTGTTGGAGFDLDTTEEVFIPVRQLSHIYYKYDGTGSGPWFTWRAS